MKKEIIFICIIFIIAIRFVSSSSVGITPAYYRDFFEPNLQKTYQFGTFNSEPDANLHAYVKGDLAQYFNVSKSNIKGGENFEVKMKLPGSIDIPGEHSIYVGVSEVKDVLSGIGAVAAVESRITIFVPYPGVYLQSSFDVSDINENEPLNYEIKLDNLGTDSIKITPEIKIYEGNTTIYSTELSEANLVTKNSTIITGKIQNNFSSGIYNAVLSLTYENKKDKIEKVFKVGKFQVEITDYSYQFERGKINPFYVEIESKWNSEIKNMYAEIFLTDNGKLIDTIKTPSVELAPWEKKNLTGYFDATSLQSKRYLANIYIHFNDGQENKLVAVYIQDLPKNETTFYLIIVASLSIALLAIILLLIKNKKNEK